MSTSGNLLSYALIKSGTQQFKSVLAKIRLTTMLRGINGSGDVAQWWTAKLRGHKGKKGVGSIKFYSGTAHKSFKWNAR